MSPCRQYLAVGPVGHVQLETFFSSPLDDYLALSSHRHILNQMVISSHSFGDATSSNPAVATRSAFCCRSCNTLLFSLYRQKCCVMKMTS